MEQQTTTLAQLRTPAAVTDNYEVGLTSSRGFELAQRSAKLLAASSLVPKDYQNNISNCVIALNMANRMGADPLMVMQNLVVVYGKPSWSSKFLIATVNTCGRFSALRFEWFGEQGTDGWGCRAWAIEKSTGEKLIGMDITIALSKAEGWYSKNGSKWKTIPQKMLMYRAGGWWCDLYSPELSMGLKTEDEIHDIVDIDASGNVTNITPANEQSTDTLRRPRKKVVADIETSEPPVELEQPDAIVDGVNQSTGEIEGDFEINPAALAGAKAEIPSGRY